MQKAACRRFMNSADMELNLAHRSMGYSSHVSCSLQIAHTAIKLMTDRSSGASSRGDYLLPVVCHLVRCRCMHVSTPTFEPVDALVILAARRCQQRFVDVDCLMGPIAYRPYPRMVNRRWSHLTAFPLCRETGLKPAKVCHTMRHPTFLSSCRRLKANSPRTKVSCSCNPRLLLLHDPSPQMRKLLSPSYPAL